MKRVSYRQVMKANSETLLHNAVMILDYLQHTNRLFLHVAETGEVVAIDGKCTPVHTDGTSITLCVGVMPDEGET